MTSEGMICRPGVWHLCRRLIVGQGLITPLPESLVNLRSLVRLCAAPHPSRIKRLFVQPAALSSFLELYASRAQLVCSFKCVLCHLLQQSESLTCHSNRRNLRSNRFTGQLPAWIGALPESLRLLYVG